MADLMTDGVISLDDRPALEAVKRSNDGLDSVEKKVKTVLDRSGREWQVYGDQVVRLSDRSRNSVDSLIRSLEKQAQVYGKSGVERLIVQRDQHIQKLAGEEVAIQRVTAAYSKMIQAEEVAAASAARAASGRSGFNLNYALRGVKDIFEGRPTFAIAEASNELGTLRGMGLAIGVVTAGLVAAGFAAYELNKHFEEMRQQPERIAAAFARLNDSEKLSNDEMKVANDRLSNTIAKLEHKPENGLKLALDEAAVAADHLADRIDKSLQKTMELLKANTTGSFWSFIGGQTNDKDIGELIGGKTGVGGLIGDVYKATSSGQDPTGVLNKYRTEAQNKLALAEYFKDAQKGTRGFLDKPPVPFTGDMSAELVKNQEARIEKLHGLIGQLNALAQSYTLEQQHTVLQGKVDVLKGGEDSQRKAKELADTLQKTAGEVSKLSAEYRALKSNLNDYGTLLVELSKIESDRRIALGENSRKFGAAGGGVGALISENARLEREMVLTREEHKEIDLMTKGAEESGKFSNVPKSLDDTMRSLGKYLGEFNKSQEDIDKLQRRHDSEMAKGHEEFVGHAIRLGGGRTPEGRAQADQMAAAVEMSMERQRVERQIVDIQLDGAKTLGEKSKEVAELRMTEEQRLQKYQEDGALRVIELQKQRFDDIAGKAESLAHTLFTNPKGFGAQLQTTLRDAALKPVEQKIGDMFATALVGRPGDSVKVSTDQNTMATMQNTAATLTLASAILNGGTGGAGITIPGLPGGTSSLGGAFGGGFGGGFGSSTLGGGGLNLGSLLGPGGTAGFAGPVSSSGTNGGGILGRIFGGRTGGGFSGGFGGMLSNIGYQGGGVWSNPGGGYAAGGGIGTAMGGIVSSPAAQGAAISGGSMLALAGLTGGRRGTWGGIAEATGGGALMGAGIGMMVGGPLGAGIGAGIGAAAGFTIGGLEKLAGVETPENEAKRLVKAMYGISIDTTTARQIAAIAKQNYGDHVSIAVRSPEVRHMMGLYAAGTGQNSPISASEPHAGSLSMLGGNLYQDATYQYGRPYAFASALPVGGGASLSGYYPSPGSSGNQYFSLNFDGKNAGDAMTGQFVTPSLVQSHFAAAQMGSDGRMGNSATLNDPGLIIS